MKFSYSVCLLALFFDAVGAFAPTSRRHQTIAETSLTKLALMTPDQIKEAGAGIPLEPAGGKRLFDPATDGQLQGTTSLDDRLKAAYQYSYLPPMQAPAVPEVLDSAQNWLEDIGSPEVPPVFAKASQPATARVLGRARTLFARMVDTL